MSDFQKRDDFIPYNVPDITDAEINEVVETLKSGWVAKALEPTVLNRNLPVISVQSTPLL